MVASTIATPTIATEKLPKSFSITGGIPYHTIPYHTVGIVIRTQGGPENHVFHYQVCLHTIFVSHYYLIVCMISIRRMPSPWAMANLQWLMSKPVVGSYG